MLEILTDALVIDKENSGEYDSRIFLYTKELGGVLARAVSARKITSKLAAHLEPLSIIQVRLVRRGGSSVAGSDARSFNISDAMVLHSAHGWIALPDAARGALGLISVLRESAFRGDADIGLWNTLYNMFSNSPTQSIESYASAILKSLGFDPRFARCRQCLAESPTQFLFQDFSFYCATCAPRASSVMLRY